MSTTYSIEHAKSGRGSCKKCKVKIAKDEIRLGKCAPGPDYDIQTWYHVECFTLPRNLKSEGIDVESFVKDMLEDNTDEQILQSRAQEFIDKISSKAKSPTKKKEVEEGKIAKIKVNIALVGAGDDGPPKKKLKLSAEDEGEMEIYGMYSGYKNDELKDILGWNGQLKSGTKNEMLLRVIDGHMHGRLGRCVLCEKGRLQIEDATGENAVCKGYYDETMSARIPCNFKCKLSEAPRLDPWYTEKPPEEEEKEDKDGGDDTEKRIAKLASKLEWNLDSKEGIKKATADLVKVCNDEKIDIPKDTKATMAVGKIVASHRESSAAEVIAMVINKFGIATQNEDKSKKKADAAAKSCVVSANAPFFEVISELRDLYFKEGNRNAGSSYAKAANAVMNLAFEITEDNAKQLGKAGKNKVDGIGKGTADKIFEFITTGKIEKLEEKRAAHAD